MFCSSTGCFTMRIYELCVDGFFPGSGQKDKLIGKAVRRPEKLLFSIKRPKVSSESDQHRPAKSVQKDPSRAHINSNSHSNSLSSTHISFRQGFVISAWLSLWIQMKMPERKLFDSSQVFTVSTICETFKGRLIWLQYIYNVKYQIHCLINYSVKI